MVDAAFAKVAQESNKDNGSSSDGKAELIGSPQTFKPAGLKDAVMKCQNVKYTPTDSTAGIKSFTIPACVWGDYSTAGVVILSDTASVLLGKSTSLSDAAATAAQVRNDTRVEIK